MKVKLEQDADQLRRDAYPSFGEQLGALVKCELARQRDEPAPADAIAVLHRVEAVKAEFPKVGGKAK